MTSFCLCRLLLAFRHLDFVAAIGIPQFPRVIGQLSSSPLATFPRDVLVVVDDIVDVIVGRSDLASERAPAPHRIV